MLPADGRDLLHGDESFRLLVDAVREYAIFLLDRDGVVMTWNSGAERIKGYSAGEIVGKHFSVFYTEDDRNAGRPAHVLRAAADLGSFEDEGWRVRRDGTRFWADVVVSALRTPAGQLYGFAKVTRDMTERRQAEEQQHRLAAEQQARAGAEAALAARDRFLSIASHELKTPVASLQLAVESVVRAAANDRLDQERLERSLDRMLRSTQRLGALVNELLDVSRLTAQTPSIDAVETDVTALAADVVARFDEPDEGRVHLLSDRPVLAEVDASRIDQVLTNLVDNALKYSGDDPAVEVEVSEADGGVLIVVGDRGIGLEEGAKLQIFDAFSRGRNVEFIQGLGLGLHIVKQIVERHGGTVDAIPRPGGGTLFNVWLPRHQADR